VGGDPETRIHTKPWNPHKRAEEKGTQKNIRGPAREKGDTLSCRLYHKERPAENTEKMSERKLMEED